MVEIIAAVHLALPVSAMLFLAARAERRKVQAEKKKLAQLLLIAARGRRIM